MKQTLKADIAKILKANFDNISRVGADMEWFKAVGDMTAASNLTGGQANVVQSYRPTLAQRANTHFHFRDIIPVVKSDTGMYVYYREEAGEGSIAVQTPHGVPKAQKDYDYTRFAVQTEYLAGYATLAKQMLEDMPFLQTGLPKQLTESYLDAEDGLFRDFLNTLTATVPVGVTNADKLLDLIRVVESNGYKPNAIIMGGANYLSILSSLSTSAYYSFWMNPKDSKLYFRGVPVYILGSLSSSQVYVMDTRQAEIITNGKISTDFSYENATNFIQNMVTVKVEQRVGCAALQPLAFARGTIT